MLTLKIKQYFYHDDKTVGSTVFDENTSYFVCEHVSVYGEVVNLDELKAWEQDSYVDLKSVLPGNTFKARLIGLEVKDKTKWFLASHAWLLGPDGKTIENLVP